MGANRAADGRRHSCGGGGGGMDADLLSAQRKLAALSIEDNKDRCSVGSASTTTSRSSSTASVPDVNRHDELSPMQMQRKAERKIRQRREQPAELPHPKDLDHHDVSLVWQSEEDCADAEVGSAGTTGVSCGAHGPRRIYVGTEKMSRYRKALDKFGIRTIVNCTRGAPNKFAEDPDFQYLHVELSDDNCEELLDKLDATTRFIEHEAEDEIVLIHCSKGVSRSISVFIAWLIRYRGISLRDSLALAKARRSVASPNMGFIRQLLTFEETHLGYTSLTMDDFLPCPVCLRVNFDSKHFACGHRCCGACLRKFPDSAVCAHCSYASGSDAAAGDAAAAARKRSSSIEDLSSWRTACPPPTRSPSPPPLAD